MPLQASCSCSAGGCSNPAGASPALLQHGTVDSVIQDEQFLAKMDTCAATTENCFPRNAARPRAILASRLGHSRQSVHWFAQQGLLAMSFNHGTRPCQHGQWQYGPWGEDLFMQFCMDDAAVAKKEDFTSTDTGTCPGMRPGLARARGQKRREITQSLCLPVHTAVFTNL